VLGLQFLHPLGPLLLALALLPIAAMIVDVVGLVCEELDHLLFGDGLGEVGLQECLNAIELGLDRDEICGTNNKVNK
jgi:hypothetical protein